MQYLETIYRGTNHQMKKIKIKPQFKKCYQLVGLTPPSPMKTTQD